MPTKPKSKTPRTLTAKSPAPKAPVIRLVNGVATTLGNTKADKSVKERNLLGANRRIVRHNGSSYQLDVTELNGTLFANATLGNAIINLFGSDPIAPTLRTLAENRIYS